MVKKYFLTEEEWRLKRNAASLKWYHDNKEKVKLSHRIKYRKTEAKNSTVRPYHILTEYEIAIIKMMMKEGSGYRRIAAVLGRKAVTIYGAIKRIKKQNESK